MSILINISIVIGGIIGMEVFAWFIHKYVMHGPGWGWHESHHTETEGLFEKNDLYAVVFSFIAAACMMDWCTDGFLSREKHAGNI